MHPPLLWTDCETTGLDPRNDLLLEFALALTDERLDVVDTFHVVIHHPRATLTMSDFVRDMHTNNGLLKDCERSMVSACEAEREAIVWAKRHGLELNPGRGQDDVGPYMAGAGINFDREVYRAQMPELARIWHYRNVDMTTLRYFFGAEKPTSVHRALPDTLQSVQEMQRLVARALSCGLLALPGLPTAV